MEQKKIEKEKEYLYWLCQIPGIGAVSMARMWVLLGSFERIYNIAAGISENVRNALLYQRFNYNFGAAQQFAFFARSVFHKKFPRKYCKKRAPNYSFRGRSALLKKAVHPLLSYRTEAFFRQ